LLPVIGEEPVQKLEPIWVLEIGLKPAQRTLEPATGRSDSLVGGFYFILFYFKKNY
jgi:hypothetical protein